MKRTALVRKTPFRRSGGLESSGGALPWSGGVRPRRREPRRREAPRWTSAQWVEGSRLLEARAGGRCERCSSLSGPFERHHRKRRRDGGDRLANLVWLCRECHGWVTVHPGEARRGGLIVSVARDPLLVPMVRFGRSWVSLDDAGGCRVLDMPLGADAHGM